MCNDLLPVEIPFLPGRNPLRRRDHRNLVTPKGSFLPKTLEFLCFMTLRVHGERTRFTLAERFFGTLKTYSSFPKIVPKRSRYQTIVLCLNLYYRTSDTILDYTERSQTVNHLWGVYSEPMSLFTSKFYFLLCMTQK